MGGHMADTDMLHKLRSVPLFAGLSDKELKDVLSRTMIVEHEGGEIVEEGRGAVGFHLILDGTVTVLQGGSVRRTLGPGDYFGEISLIDGKPRSATVRPDGTVRTLSLAAWNFAPLLDAHPTMARTLLLGLCHQLRSAEARPA
jgi:cAMP-binding proteins - catabolite gene activator and regulatory subunit of cAMP-dependent protein kinases